MNRFVEAVEKDKNFDWSSLMDLLRELSDSHNYDGIAAWEHEKWNRIDLHDSFCVFDPDKIEIINEKQIQSE